MNETDLKAFAGAHVEDCDEEFLEWFCKTYARLIARVSDPHELAVRLLAAGRPCCR